MEMSKHSLDLLLVPLSILITAIYHFYLWHNSRAKHPKTSIGANLARKRLWIQSIASGDDDKAFLAVQTSRNSLLAFTSTASVALAINAALASLASSANSSSRSLSGHQPFGSRAGEMLLLKYSPTSLLLLFSFLCSSRAAGCIIEASFLMHANGGEALTARGEEMMMRGAVLATVGNRALYVGVSFLMWMLGPAALVLSTVGMTWLFYVLDYKKVCLRVGGKKI